MNGKITSARAGRRPADMEAEHSKPLAAALSGGAILGKYGVSNVSCNREDAINSGRGCPRLAGWRLEVRPPVPVPCWSDCGLPGRETE